MPTRSMVVTPFNRSMLRPVAPIAASAVESAA
jgi:hypothetical protein